VFVRHAIVTRGVAHCGDVSDVTSAIEGAKFLGFRKRVHEQSYVFTVLV